MLPKIISLLLLQYVAWSCKEDASFSEERSEVKVEGEAIEIDQDYALSTPLTTHFLKAGLFANRVFAKTEELSVNQTEMEQLLEAISDGSSKDFTLLSVNSFRILGEPELQMTNSSVAFETCVLIQEYKADKKYMVVARTDAEVTPFSDTQLTLKQTERGNELCLAQDRVNIKFYTIEYSAKTLADFIAELVNDPNRNEKTLELIKKHLQVYINAEYTNEKLISANGIIQISGEGLALWNLTDPTEIKNVITHLSQGTYTLALSITLTKDLQEELLGNLVQEWARILAILLPNQTGVDLSKEIAKEAVLMLEALQGETDFAALFAMHMTLGLTSAAFLSEEELNSYESELLLYLTSHSSRTQEASDANNTSDNEEIVAQATTSSLVILQENPIIIEDGRAKTGKETVTLGFNVTNASEMYITNTPDCSDGGQWEDFAASKENWPLIEASNPAVYVYFKDAQGLASDCVSSSIEMDTSVPAGSSIVLNQGLAFSRFDQIDIAVNSPQATEMYITNVAGCAAGGEWVAYNQNPTPPVFDPQAGNIIEVYVKFRNIAHNESECLGGSVKYDATPPSEEDGALSVSNEASTSLEFTWNDSQERDDSPNGSSGAHIEYALFYHTGDSQSVLESTNILGIKALTSVRTGSDYATGGSPLTAEGLTSGESYNFYLLARDQAGNESLIDSYTQVLCGELGGLEIASSSGNVISFTQNADITVKAKDNCGANFDHAGGDFNGTVNISIIGTALTLPSKVSLASSTLDFSNDGGDGTMEVSVIPEIHGSVDYSFKVRADENGGSLFAETKTINASAVVLNNYTDIGSGTSESPYKIYSAAQLASISSNPGVSTYLELHADIDLQRDWYDPPTNGAQFRIGGSGIFSSHFNGNGYTISNFSYSSPGTSHVGLFRNVQGGLNTIINLTLENPTVVGGNNTGALLGQVFGATLDQITITGANVTGEDSTGGIGGSMQQTGSYTNLTVRDSTINGQSDTGGVFGYAGSSIVDQVTVSNTTVGMTGSGEFAVGGVIGEASSMNISHANVSVTVNAADETSGHAGGIVGTSYNSLNVVNSFADVTINAHATSSAGGVSGQMRGGTIHATCVEGDINVEYYAGGLIGYASSLMSYAQAIFITDSCFRNGTVTATAGGGVGGIVGTTTSGELDIRNTYTAEATLDVSANNSYASVGGIIGKADQQTIVKHSFVDANVLGESGSASGAGSICGQCTGEYDNNTLQSTGRTLNVSTANPNGTTVLTNADIYKTSHDSFPLSDWDFTNSTTDGHSNIWLKETSPTTYPKLWHEIETDADPIALSGTGTQADPYVISEASQIYQLSNPRFSNKHIDLTVSVDFSSDATFYDNANPFKNMMTHRIPFYAHLTSSNQSTFSNITLNFNDSGERFVGPFLYLTDMASIKNVRFSQISVTGYSQVGGVAATASGHIENVSLTNGTITQSTESDIGSHTRSRFGGIVGACNICTAIGNSFHGSISAPDSSEVGGILGIGRALPSSWNNTLHTVGDAGLSQTVIDSNDTNAGAHIGLGSQIYYTPNGTTANTVVDGNSSPDVVGAIQN